MLLTSVFCVSLCVGCGDDDNGEKSGPAPKISLTAGETAPFSVSFTALVENASKCAYVVLTERNDALTAREILSDSGIELPPPAWTEPVVLPELAPSTDYYVYAAAAGENDRLSEVASLVLTTLEDPANDLTQQFESLHTPGVAEQNGDNFYFGLSSGETEIQGGLTVTKQAGYAVLFDLYGAASADAVIPDGTYELAQGHVPPSADPRHTYATRRLEDGTWEVLTFAAGEVSVSREGANYLLAANVETPAGERLSFRYAGPIEMKPIDMTGSRLKHAVNVALEEVTAVCYKEYNDPGVDWTQLKFWTGEVDKRGGLVKGTLFGVELNMPTTDDRGDLKLVPGEYEVNASREAFTMVPGAIMDYMPGMLMAYGTYCMQSDANGKILSGAAQDYGRVTVGYENGVYHIDIALISVEGITMRGTYDGPIPVTDK